MSPDKRWVVVGDPGGQGARFVIAKAEGERQLAAVGAQAGGRVGYFLETDDFARDFARFRAERRRVPGEPRGASPTASSPCSRTPGAASGT